MKRYGIVFTLTAISHDPEDTVEGAEAFCADLSKILLDFAPENKMEAQVDYEVIELTFPEEN